jgi:hypothetical protein
MSITGLRSTTRNGDWLIRVEQRADGAKLEIKQSTEKMCARNGRKAVAMSSRIVNVDSGTWARIASCMDREFWNGPKKLDHEMFLDDGDSISIEGTRDGRYKVHHRSNFVPFEDGSPPHPLGDCVGLLEKTADKR